MDPSWALLGIALGGGGFLTVGVQELIKRLTGRAQAEREANKDLASRTDLAERQEDWERRARVIWETYAAQLAIFCIQHGGTPPTAPTPEQTLGPKP